MYIEPSKDYNFKENSDYLMCVTNAGAEDTDLEFLIINTHKDITITMRDTKIDLKEHVTPLPDKTILECVEKTFNNINDVISFIKKSSDENFFFIHSYLNLKLKYALLPYTYIIKHPDMQQHRRERILNILT